MFFEAVSLAGFLDYNNTVAAADVAAGTWYDIPNNGAGSFSNLDYAPVGITGIIDTSTGAIDPTGLSLGDILLIRNDFTITPTINDTLMDFRYALGTGAGAYTLPKKSIRLTNGAGVADRLVSSTDLIYMGDNNTRYNPIVLQVRCSAAFNVLNAGSAIAVLRR